MNTKQIDDAGIVDYEINTDTELKKATTDNIHHCVQCAEPISKWVGLHAWVCEAADCPNFGLLQLGIEWTPKEAK